MPEAPQRIDRLLPGVLKRTREHSTTLRTIQRGWGALVGKDLAAHTKPAGLRRGRLLVLVESPGDSFTLSYKRSQILQRLRRRTEGRVDDLVVRVGDVRTT
jgi:hypothetical protein